VRVVGRDYIPERSSALFVAESLTTIEALLLTAAIDRRMHFLVTGKRPKAATIVERILRIEPISRPEPSDDETLLNIIASKLRRGDVICLAWPGASELLRADSPDRLRLETLVQMEHVPAVSVYLSGAEHGILRAEGGRLRWDLSAQWPSHAEAHFGVPAEL
jgi:hypothetical protein